MSAPIRTNGFRWCSDVRRSQQPNVAMRVRKPRVSAAAKSAWIAKSVASNPVDPPSAWSDHGAPESSRKAASGATPAPP